MPNTKAFSNKRRIKKNLGPTSGIKKSRKNKVHGRKAQQDYYLSSVTPNEGRKGDVVTLEGKFPPQNQLQIIFGDYQIQPSLSFNKKLQCVVPNGRFGSNVPVFIIFNKNITSEIQNFHYKPFNDSLYSELLKEVKEVIAKTKKTNLKDSMNEEQKSKFKRMEDELDVYEIILNNSRMYEIIPKMEMEQKLGIFKKFLKELRQ